MENQRRPWLISKRDGEQAMANALESTQHQLDELAMWILRVEADRARILAFLAHARGRADVTDPQRVLYSMASFGGGSLSEAIRQHSVYQARANRLQRTKEELDTHLEAQRAQLQAMNERREQTA